MICEAARCFSLGLALQVQNLNVKVVAVVVRHDL